MFRVGVVDDGTGHDKIVPLRQTQSVRAGQLGQVESVRDNAAIVRFYRASRIERFGSLKNSLKHWATESGGTHPEKQDEFFAQEFGDILLVPLSEIIEVNDYLDEARSDRTGGDENKDKKYADQRKERDRYGRQAYYY